ncbi:hypothetical protein EYF80_012338 [Liparis tanakae]|uniref:Uncharacterized protein n=1 Tax=Liparis tanakae TaxID=230148 RepID=A0A4Z2IIV7_9TELE|nr:hypothetical protein EYF80_012338 [Liparis tanakae]
MSTSVPNGSCSDDPAEVSSMRTVTLPAPREYPLPRLQAYPLPRLQAYPPPRLQEYPLPRLQAYPLRLQAYPPPRLQEYPLRLQEYPLPRLQEYPLRLLQEYPLPRLQEYPLPRLQAYLLVLPLQFLGAGASGAAFSSVAASASTSRYVKKESNRSTGLNVSGGREGRVCRCAGAFLRVGSNPWSLQGAQMLSSVRASADLSSSPFVWIGREKVHSLLRRYDRRVQVTSQHDHH